MTRGTKAAKDAQATNTGKDEQEQKAENLLGKTNLSNMDVERFIIEYSEKGPRCPQYSLVSLAHI